MKKKLIIFLIALGIMSTVMFMFQKNDQVEESIIFFPIDSSISFKLTKTDLSLPERTNTNDYSFLWKVTSILEQKAYLRQDISLLYKNGRLISKMGKWEQNTDTIVQDKSVQSQESGQYMAISFHHAELHPENEQIFSAQQISEDLLYVIDSSFSPFSAFHQPKKKEEKEWKHILDQITNQDLAYSWQKGIETYHINKENYFFIPLSKLINYQNFPLPSFSKEKTDQIIGQLWEGLYKNYFLGIQKKNGSFIDPVGSKMPLILLSKDRTHLLVLFEASDGEMILLRQHITSP
ncbi:hypothetical protein [Bacillus sp. 03113]|uniref:hypothetical protein n=1 Tax=Bacillus sp. 03113 TaxID=2578211 RepID=UPI00114443B9|nr:hypothetical protein [Bacillus sp. 03113]